jgi:hypothetical protein
VTIEEVGADLNITRVEMVKHFGLVPSLLRNIILPKDKGSGNEMWSARKKKEGKM